AHRVGLGFLLHALHVGEELVLVQGGQVHVVLAGQALLQAVQLQAQLLGLKVLVVAGLGSGRDVGAQAAHVLFGRGDGALALAAGLALQLYLLLGAVLLLEQAFELFLKPGVLGLAALPLLGGDN